MTRPEIIEVPVIRYTPVPLRLTVHIPEPAPPPQHCRWHGQPAVCVLDGLATIPLWRGTLHKANVDRATAAKLGTKGTHDD